MEERGKGVDSFVLWSYPIWVQCLNNFVADCSLLFSIKWQKEENQLLAFVVLIPSSSSTEKPWGRDCPRTLSWDSQAVREGVVKWLKSARQKFSFSGRSAGSLQSFLNHSGDLVSGILGDFVQFIVAAPDFVSTVFPLSQETFERGEEGGEGRGEEGREHGEETLVSTVEPAWWPALVSDHLV